MNLPFRIKNAMLLENFGNDRDCRVYGIRDHEYERFRRNRSDPSRKVTHDARIDLEKSIVVVCENSKCLP